MANPLPGSPRKSTAGRQPRVRARCCEVGASRSLVQVGLVVVPGEDIVEGVARFLGQFFCVTRLPEGRVPLEQVDSHAVAMGGVPIPRAGLVGVAERFLAQPADLRRGADPRDSPGRSDHGAALPTVRRGHLPFRKPEAPRRRAFCKGPWGRRRHTALKLACFSDNRLLDRGIPR